MAKQDLPVYSSTLTPTTEFCLTLAVYTLLVLTLILGGESIMLYTQSPVIQGGLEFSAQTFGLVLTVRGILKLSFNRFGFSWMANRFGLLNCLKMGVIATGITSVFGLGWFVPWDASYQCYYSKYFTLKCRAEVALEYAEYCCVWVSSLSGMFLDTILYWFGKFADHCSPRLNDTVFAIFMFIFLFTWIQ
jgi:hypothetical protein